jgi:hypothetical protein
MLENSILINIVQTENSERQNDFFERVLEEKRRTIREKPLCLQEEESV